MVASSTRTIAIASHDDTVFYGLHTGGTVELHRRVGGMDTVFGSVSAGGPVSSRRPPPRSSSTAPRSGGGRATVLPRPPSSPRWSAPGGDLRWGSTVGAFVLDGKTQLFDLAGPSTPVQQMGNAPVFVGDNGYWFAAGDDHAEHEVGAALAVHAGVDGGVPADADTRQHGPAVQRRRGAVRRRDLVWRSRKWGQRVSVTPRRIAGGESLQSGCGDRGRQHLHGVVQDETGAWSITTVAKP